MAPQMPNSDNIKMRRTIFRREDERRVIDGVIEPSGEVFERGISYREPVKVGSKEIQVTLVRYSTIHAGTGSFPFYASLPRNIEGHVFCFTENPSTSLVSQIPEHQTLSVAPVNNNETTRFFYFHKDTRTKLDIVVSKISRRGMSRDLQTKLPDILGGVMAGKEYYSITRDTGVSGDWVRRVQSRYEEMLAGQGV